MATRNNAFAEIVRFWLCERHGYLTMESVPVEVKGPHSDIDIVALHPSDRAQEVQVGGRVVELPPRLAVECKGEYDFEPSANELTRSLVNDLQMAAEHGGEVEAGTKRRFSLLRSEHGERARAILGGGPIGRLIVLHNLDTKASSGLDSLCRQCNVSVLTIREIVDDLIAWVGKHPRPASLRMTWTGEFFHLLFNFCLKGRLSEN